MLHKETVAPQTLDLIKRLFKDAKLSDFVLVGGTALSLQIGHRISIDIDLFNDKPFDAANIASHLQKNYNTENVKTLKNGVFCFIDDIKVDVMSHQYPWVKAPIVSEGIRMVSLEDIGAMKLHAIVQSGSRLKDFIDIYFLLGQLSFQDLFGFYEKKYPDTSKAVVQKALLYDNDIKPSSIDMIGKSIDFERIAARIKESILNPSKTFSQQKTNQDLTVRKRKRGRGI